MAKGRFNIKGTKDFLVAAVFCGFLCLWAIRDAWFPTRKVLEKHPLEVAVAFDVSGVVKDIPVDAGDQVKGETVLATLYDQHLQERVDAAKAAFEAAKGGEEAVLQEKLDELMLAREDLKAATLKNTDILRTTSHGEEALHGTVLQVIAEPATQIEAGETIMLIRPDDSFYIFNQTLAVLSFIGTIVFLVFHGIASK